MESIISSYIRYRKQSKITVSMPLLEAYEGNPQRRDQFIYDLFTFSGLFQGYFDNLITDLDEQLSSNVYCRMLDTMLVSLCYMAEYDNATHNQDAELCRIFQHLLELNEAPHIDNLPIKPLADRLVSELGDDANGLSLFFFTIYDALTAGQTKAQDLIYALMGVINKAEHELLEVAPANQNIGQQIWAAYATAGKPDYQKDVAIDYSNLPKITRRYMLEMAYTNLLEHGYVADQHSELIIKLGQQIGLSSREVKFSLHNSNVFLHEMRRQEAQPSSRSTDRITSLLRLNLRRIVAEIEETKELYQLLTKQTPLTNEERDKVYSQLSDILRAIPALAVFMLPGGVFILTILIKLLPFNLLPSNFREGNST